MVPYWQLTFTDENGAVFSSQFMIPKDLSEDDNDRYMAEGLGASVISINKQIKEKINQRKNSK